MTVNYLTVAGTRSIFKEKQMFIDDKTKTISTLLRFNSSNIKSGLYNVFENSIIGCSSEIQFLGNLKTNMKSFISSLKISGLSLSCRAEVIHQKPLVSFSSRNCELGDLLVVVKYHLPSGGFEAKSMIYQVKLTRGNSLICDIKQNQLDLLCDWPQFSFGRASSGGPITYNIRPYTLEFGSFMLEQRNPSAGSYLVGKSSCYGICPYAMFVRHIGPNSVKIDNSPYTRGDANHFFSHLIFEIGEHHVNQPVRDLVDALYRYLGLTPDPPDEFIGYWEEFEDDGFAIIETNVEIKEG